jgi:4-amino-4-deoxy-L-arabinose transferase-like glycosyltransferase
VSPATARRAGALGVVALSLGASALYMATASGPSWVDPLIDADYNDHLGVEVAAGRGLPPGPFWQPPLYPFLLGTLYRVLGPHLWAPRAAQALLAAATAAAVLDLARRLTPGHPRAALAAGALCALHGPLVFYAGELLPTTLAIFLATLAIWRAALPGDGLDRAVQSGVACGLAAAALPAVLPLVAALAYLAAAPREDWPDAGGRPAPRATRATHAALATLAACALAIAPVTLANHARSGEWVLLSANAGVNLWIGNNPEGEALQRVRPGEAWESLMAEPAEAGARSASEADAYFARRALAYCAGSPASCAAGLLRKARLLLASRELPRNEDLTVVRRSAPVLRALTAHLGAAHLPYALLFPLAIAGAAAAVRRGRDAHLARGLSLAALCLALAPVAFFVTGRYRAPLAPLLCALAAPGLVAIAGRQRFPMAAAGLALAIAAWPVEAPTDGIDFEAEMYFAQGGRRARLGDDEGAISAWHQALARRPDYLEAAFDRALALERLGRLGEARRALQDMVDRHPGHPGATGRLRALTPPLPRVE